MVLDLPLEIIRVIFFEHIDYGKTLFLCRGICKTLQNFIDNHFIIEIDRTCFINPPYFLKNRLAIKQDLLQKRNTAMEWDDHRGFLVIVQIHEQDFDYYDNRMRFLFFYSYRRPSIFKGQMLFYEFPS